MFNEELNLPTEIDYCSAFGVVDLIAKKNSIELLWKIEVRSTTGGGYSKTIQKK